jgi:pyruvate formate lyase activating enzyme
MSEALEMIGKTMTVEEIMVEIRKENSFYSRSGGGVTISGGEPTLQYDFLLELLKVLKNENYQIVLETSGILQWNKLELLARYVDIFYFDIKGIDPVLHKTNTGIDNGEILSNACKLSEQKSSVVFRIPIIPGINYTPDQISQLDQFLTKVEAKQIHLLPYHSFGEDKLKSIHTHQVRLGIPSMKIEYLENLRNALEHSKRNVIISGN